MARTLQKKIVFSRGQIASGLVERSELEIFDKSAQCLKNFNSTVYGGLRSRRGTRLIGNVQSYTDGIATDYCGGKSEDIQNPATVYSTQNIYNRVIFDIDYSKVMAGSGQTFYLRGIKLSQMAVAQYRLIQKGTFKNPIKNKMRIELHGGGGGSSCYGGGAGAYINVETELEAGDYTIVAGNGGDGAGAYARNNNGRSGETSSFSGPGCNIVCPGGSAGYGHRNDDGSKSGNSYAPAVDIDHEYKILAASRNTKRREGWADTYSKDMGSGGKEVDCKSAGNKGYDGYVNVYLLNVPAAVETSVDGRNWEIAQQFLLNTDEQNIAVPLNKEFRYIRLRVTLTGEYVVAGHIILNFARLSAYNGSVSKSVKLIPYTYNNADKYVLILADGVVSIYHNDVFEDDITAPALNADVMKDLKYTCKDDTIIFTHQDFRPKILKRTTDGWVFSDLEITNIPYTLFGAEKEEAKTIAIKPSALEGAVKITADSDVFSASYVGQYIDGGGGKAKITEFIDAKNVSGNTIIPFYTDDKIEKWTYISGYQASWSSSHGWPRTCLFAQQRLWFGGSKDKPTTVWASRVGDYFNFKNAGNYNNDAINIDLTAQGVTVNMLENRGIHVFTSDEEISIPENSLTPDDIRSTTNTQNGSLAHIKPVVFDGVAAFIEKNGKSLLSYVYNDEQASYKTDNLSMLSNLLNEPLAMDAEVNSAKDKGNFLYIVLADGRMLVCCLVPGDTINSISQFVTYGQVIDVCCSGGDTYILVNRDDALYLEKICDVLTDVTKDYEVAGNEVALDGFYQGKRVWVYNDNLDIAEAHTVPTDGVVKLNQYYYGTLHVGLAFDYQLVGNPIAINGRTFSIKKRITKAVLVCENTPQLCFGDQKKRDCDVYEFFGCTPYNNDVRYDVSGEFWPVNILSLEMSINYEG